MQSIYNDNPLHGTGFSVEKFREDVLLELGVDFDSEHAFKNVEMQLERKISAIDQSTVDFTPAVTEKLKYLDRMKNALSKLRPLNGVK